MMDLLELDLAVAERALDRVGVSDCIVGVGVQRLDHRAHAAPSDTGRHERVRIGDAEQAGFDADTAHDERLAERDDAVLALVGRHQIWQLGPGRHEREPSLGIGLDPRRRAQRHRDGRARRPHGA